MWLAACTAVKTLESFTEVEMGKNVSMIFEAKKEDKLFTGIRLIEKRYENEQK